MAQIPVAAVLRDKRGHLVDVFVFAGHLGFKVHLDLE